MDIDHGQSDGDGGEPDGRASDHGQRTETDDGTRAGTPVVVENWRK
jgi:hypothetical protein